MMWLVYVFRCYKSNNLLSYKSPFKSEFKANKNVIANSSSAEINQLKSIKLLTNNDNLSMINKPNNDNLFKAHS